MPAKAVIDMEHLARYTGGDAKLNAEILHLFDSQTSGLVGKLRAILDARDAKAWREVTHTIKGAARGIGAFDFADVAASCEHLDLNDSGAAMLAIEQLGDRADAVQTFIKAVIST